MQIFTDMEFSQIFTWPPTPAKWRALKDYLLSEKIHAGQNVRLSRSSAGVMVSTAQVRRSGGAVRPFTPHIVPGETAGTYKIVSTGGFVMERETTDIDAPTILHEVEDLAATEITDGDSLFLEIPTDDRGAIDPPCIFVVAPTETGGDVQRYYPPDNNGDASAGDFRIEVASFEIDEATPILTRKYSGQHIQHSQDLPTLENAAENDATVFKGYDKESAAYMFRALLGGTGINVEQNEDDVEISPDGSSFNLIFNLAVLSINDSGSSPFIEIDRNDSAPFLFCVRDGRLMVPEDVPADDVDGNDPQVNPHVPGEKYARYVFDVVERVVLNVPED